MNNRDIILISTRVTEESEYQERRAAIAYEYVNWFEDDRRLVVPVPASTGHAERYLDIAGVTLIVLTGGNNVNPKLYGSSAEVSQVYPERDRTEYALISQGIRRGIPIWGICRGLHTINVYFGGTLTPQVEGHVACDHTLVSTNQLLNGVTCNSYHNQAVTVGDLSRDLLPLATTPDGLVEALYHPDYAVAAVQWHPERQERPYDRTLLQRFLAGILTS